MLPVVPRIIAFRLNQASMLLAQVTYLACTTISFILNKGAEENESEKSKIHDRINQIR